MGKEENTFLLGRHRPVYLWAGPGTIRMNRLKFMGAPVDEAVHLEAHSPLGARRMVEEAAFNWAYLTYNWGFPPEVEQEDWQAFRRVVPVFQAAGLRVFGYVQASNCVHDGSFKGRDWYALDPRGRPFYYYTGRYMTCWLHPEWLEHLRDMTSGVIEAGADGVFYDNPWHAGQPFLWAGRRLGPVGCYCSRCRASFRAATGLEIPTLVSPDTDEASCRYLRWRADLVTQTLSDLADYARSLKPDVVVSVNDFDAVMRPSYLIYGIDLPALAKVQDVLMIEDYGLPRWECSENDAQRPGTPALLVNNALTLRTAAALARGTPVSTDPYDKGIGFDGVYPPRRFQQGIAEAAACGVPMVVKGTEFVEGERFTLLTADAYAPQRLAIGGYQRWLEEHAALYEGRENLAPVGLLYPGADLWQHWGRISPAYFGAGQALVAAGIPWRVVAAPEQLEGLWALLAFGPLPPDWDVPLDLKVIDVPGLPGWEPPALSLLARHSVLRRAASFVASEVYRAYFRYRWARWLLERVGMVHFFLQSPYFQLLPESFRQALLAELGQGPWPRLDAKAPVLVEWWQKRDVRQVHLVNYAARPQQVEVDFGRPVAGQVLSPDGPVQQFRAERISLVLDVYTVVQYRAGAGAEG